MSDILCVLNPAGQNVRQGLSSLPDISRSLPDMSGMSGIFRDYCSIAVNTSNTDLKLIVLLEKLFVFVLTSSAKIGNYFGEDFGYFSVMLPITSLLAMI